MMLQIVTNLLLFTERTDNPIRHQLPGRMKIPISQASLSPFSSQEANEQILHVPKSSNFQHLTGDLPVCSWLCGVDAYTTKEVVGGRGKCTSSSTAHVAISCITSTTVHAAEIRSRPTKTNAIDFIHLWFVRPACRYAQCKGIFSKSIYGSSLWLLCNETNHQNITMLYYRASSVMDALVKTERTKGASSPGWIVVGTIV